MRSVKYLMLSAVLLLSAGAIQAQTAEEIVGKHIEAIGGKEKIGQIKSMVTESSMQAMGSESPVIITILNGKGWKSETDFNGQKIVSCLTDKGGWAINPMMGSATAEALPDEQYQAQKEQIHIGSPFYDYAARGTKIELVGKEEGNFKLKAVSGSNESFYFIDSATYYIVKTTRKTQMMGQEMEIIVTLSDYKKTDFGYVVPYSVGMDFGGQFQMTNAVKKVEFNKEIDPKIFEMPK